MKGLKICAAACLIAVAAVAGTAFANSGNAAAGSFSSQVVYNYTAYGQMLDNAVLAKR